MAAMSSPAYSRKKQPELVRRAILDEVARLVSTGGAAAVTIQAVADGAGVTKGGVFHHFPSKHALIAGLLDDMLERLDAAIARHLETDHGRGRFTRAYIDVMMIDRDFGVGSPLDAITLSGLADESMTAAWEQWLRRSLKAHKATDGDTALEIVRYAVDGAWLAHLGKKPGAKLKALRDRLIDMTRDS